jgi:hypothetical protein
MRYYYMYYIIFKPHRSLWGCQSPENQLYQNVEHSRGRKKADKHEERKEKERWITAAMFPRGQSMIMESGRGVTTNPLRPLRAPWELVWYRSVTLWFCLSREGRVEGDIGRNQYGTENLELFYLSLQVALSCVTWHARLILYSIIHHSHNAKPHWSSFSTAACFLSIFIHCRICCYFYDLWPILLECT